MMKRSGILWVLIVIFSVTVSVAVAGNNDDGSSGGKQGTGGNDSAQTEPAGDQIQDRDKKNDCDNETDPSRDRMHDRLGENTAQEPGPGYQTQDGEIHRWNHRHTERAKQYEDQDNPDALNRYLKRIAKWSYRFKNHEDTDGFVQWALENRPWGDKN